jgi:hypothetical protein
MQMVLANFIVPIKVTTPKVVLATLYTVWTPITSPRWSPHIRKKLAKQSNVDSGVESVPSTDDRTIGAKYPRVLQHGFA